MAAGAAGAVDLPAPREVGRPRGGLVERNAVALARARPRQSDPSGQRVGGPWRRTSARSVSRVATAVAPSAGSVAGGPPRLLQKEAGLLHFGGRHDRAIHDADRVLLGGQGGGGGHPADDSRGIVCGASCWTRGGSQRGEENRQNRADESHFHPNLNVWE